MKTLVAQIDILETMTPSSFSSFRDRLETASGFQSVQFRESSSLLGYKRASTLAHVKPDFPGYDRLQQRLDERTVVDHFYDFLETRGAQIPTELKNRDVTQPNGPDERVQKEILRLYKNSPECSILFELMTDFDEGLQEWRYRHVKLVERTIGAKKGTGGSPGVPFLKESLFRPIFHDLWAIRHDTVMPSLRNRYSDRLSRSLGNPARTVTAAPSPGMTKHESRVELTTAEKFAHCPGKQLGSLFFSKVHGFDQFARMRFA